MAQTGEESSEDIRDDEIKGEEDEEEEESLKSALEAARSTFSRVSRR